MSDRTVATNPQDTTNLKEKIIVEEACAMFRISQEMLTKSVKENLFWKKIAGCIVYLLKIDGTADDATIAACIGDVPSSIAEHFRYIEDRIKDKDQDTVYRIGRIRDMVLDRIQNMGVPKED